MRQEKPEDKFVCSATDCRAPAKHKLSESVALCDEHERQRKAGMTIPVRSPVLERVPTPNILNAKHQAEADTAAEAAKTEAVELKIDEGGK